MNTKKLTNDNFDREVLASQTPVVVDFWAAWCGPCRIVGPIVDDLSVEFADRALVGKLNIDENVEIANQYGIQAIPALLFFQNGAVVDRVVGVTAKAILSDKLNALLTSTNATSSQSA
ncbi:MAG: thioredoxin [Scytolyngbya sp. HA4215-MV1]|nr:thioredoxin [Scytolyngbya sp. HA4215-MV1]